MLITRLRLANFRQHEDTDLTLGPGLIGIVGANGAGKTTLLEAIAWVMYGAPAARGNKDTIRRRGAPPRSKVEVEMEFELGSHHHRVVRGLNHASLYLDGSAEPVASSIDGVTERIERLLGMTRDEFFNTYFTGQKELAVMAEMKPTERARFLSRVLGYEKLGGAQERNRVHRNEVNTRTTTLRATLADPDLIARAEQAAASRLAAAQAAKATATTRADAARVRLATAGPDVERLGALQQTAATLDGDLRVAAAALASAEIEVARSETLLKSATEAAARLAELELALQPLMALREEERALARVSEGARDRDVLAQTQADEVVRQATLTADVERIPTPAALAGLIERGKQLRAESLEAEKAAAELRLAWSNDKQEAETKRQALLDQYRDLELQMKQVEQSGSDGPCPTCGKPLGDGRAKVQEMLADKMEEVRLNGIFYARRIDQLTDEPADLKAADLRRTELASELEEARRLHALMHAEAKRGDDLRSQLAIVSERVIELNARLAAAPPTYDRTRHASLKTQLAELERLALERERAAVAAGERERAETALATARMAMIGAAAGVTSMQIQRQMVGFDAAAYAAAQETLQRANVEERAAQVALTSAEAEVKAANAEVAKAAADRAAYEERLEQVRTYEREQLLRNELDRAFTDLRTDLNNDLRPELAELASGFLGDLTHGRYDDLELDEQYMATVVDDGEAKSVISGGEEDVVNLSLRLAISQMIADRAGQPLSLLVLDEIFGSLDEARRMAVVELLRGLADRFPQVILITHIDTVRDGFDRIVRVRYDGVRRSAIVTDEPLEGRDVAA